MPDSVIYGWTGAANASPSIQRVNGVETRRNRIPNPVNGASLLAVGASRASIALGEGFARATITDPLAGANAQRIVIGTTNIASSYAIAVTPGVAVPFSLDLRNSTGSPMSVYAYYYTPGNVYDSNELLSVTLPVSATQWTRHQLTARPSANAGVMLIYAGTGNSAREAGDTFDVRNVMVGDTGAYFDGSFPSSVYGNAEQAGLGRLDLDGYPELNGSTSALGEGLSGVVGVPEFLAAVYRESEGMLRLAGKEPRRLSLRVPSFRTEMSS